MTRYEVTEAIQVEEYEDEGSSYLAPSRTLPPFPEGRVRAGNVPSHGDVLDLDFGAIRRGEAYGNTPRS